MNTKCNFIKRTIARDRKTGRFVTMSIAKRRPTKTIVSTVLIPVR